MNSSEYYRSYNTYSGADIKATITPVGGREIVIGELQTISYSIHREKYPVRTLGRINPRAYTSGPRTVAGSMIFTVFDRHIIKDIISGGFTGEPYDSIPPEDKYNMYYTMKIDELPPMDVTITLKNEYGQSSVIRIYGITIVDEGQTMSIEDIVTEQTMSYLAVGIDIMDVAQTPIGGGVVD
jgi:hypothetical protein